MPSVGVTSKKIPSVYFPETLVVGGVKVAPVVVEEALSCLRTAGGPMIRQPLTRIGNPLANCDYHAVSQPWREQFSAQTPSGRGAAGRPIAKEAFCFALEQILGEMSPESALRRLLADALSAFSSDHAYAAAMAKAAVSIAAKRHTAALRDTLRQAAHRATSECDAWQGTFTCTNPTPCGTGGCKFAMGELALISVESLTGKQERPLNHALPSSGGFSSDDALSALEKLRPFVVPIPIRDSDSGHFSDELAGTAA